MISSRDYMLPIVAAVVAWVFIAILVITTF